MDDTQAPSPGPISSDATEPAFPNARSAAVHALCELAALPQAGFPKTLRSQVNGLLHELSAVAGPCDSGNFQATLDELSDDQLREALDRISACRQAALEWQASPYT